MVRQDFLLAWMSESCLILGQGPVVFMVHPYVHLLSSVCNFCMVGLFVDLLLCHALSPGLCTSLPGVCW